MRRIGVLVATMGLLIGASAAGASQFRWLHWRPGTVLITPDGTPIGGKWQTWVNQSQVPTVRSSLVFETPERLGCGAAGACSVGPVPPFPYAGYASAASDRSGLLFELGHQFDWHYLTTRDRRRFARIWHVHGRWWDSRKSLLLGSEDGLEADFALAYQWCAEGWEVGVLGAFGTPSPPTIYASDPHATCRLIRAIARRN